MTFASTVGWRVGLLLLVASVWPGGVVSTARAPGLPRQPSTTLTALPLRSIPLDDLTAFRHPPDNWQIVGGVQSDYQQTHSLIVQRGAGVLANVATTSDGGHLFTQLEHGDLELKVELLVPKGSNSGLYFQQRYELQILDSWGKAVPEHSDLGGIYQRWDESRSAGSEGYEGHAPSVNAALAPGLWQEYHALFRAPRFDASGNKIRNARFDWVYVNGVRVHESVELSGPTRSSFANDEVARAPLMIQGDHGPVAFRNLRYKTFDDTNELTLGPLRYTVYDYQGLRLPASFDSLQPIAEGATNVFDVELSPQADHYVMRFSGDLRVPVSGDYLFETQSSDGGSLSIDGELILENTGAIDERRLATVVRLDAGTHRLDLTYLQIVWNRYIRVSYEGPAMEKRTLGAPPSKGIAGASTPQPILVAPGAAGPELVGGFVTYGGEKRTHALSVGHPEGMHYSYDLRTGALLKFWRGGFADVTHMWHARGLEQLLVPLNVSVESRATSLLAIERAVVPLAVHHYILGDAGRPVFVARHGDVTIEDALRPSEHATGFDRRVRYSATADLDGAEGIVAQAADIDRLPNGLFRIGGRYYVDLDETGRSSAAIVDRVGVQWLVVSILRGVRQTDVHYRLIW